MESEAAHGDSQSYLHGFVGTGDSLAEKFFGVPDRKKDHVGLSDLGRVDAEDTHGQICAKPHHHRGYFSHRIS